MLKLDKPNLGTAGCHFDINTLMGEREMWIRRQVGRTKHQAT